MPRPSKSPTVAQLQQIAQACGIAKSGTKSLLAARIVSALAAHKPVTPAERILSIDMGLRNFAFCHFTLGAAPKSRGAARTAAKKLPSGPAPSPTTAPPSALLAGSEGPGGRNLLPGPALTLHSWEVLDLMAEASGAGTGAGAGALDFGSKTDLSAVAVDVVQQHLLLPPPLRPTRVLIEQQRYRSSHGSSVLEWTLRVNTLEAMLHAVFATLRRHGHWAGAVEAVNPLLSATHFFDEGGRIPPRMLKKMKIDLLGGWICGGSGSDDGAPGASVTMGASAAERTAAVFRQKWRPVKEEKKKKKTKKSLDDNCDDDDDDGGATKPGVQAKKLDDLTDCVIQGAAWSSWQDMKTKLAQDGTKEMLEQLM